MKSRTDLRVGDQKRDATDQAINTITYKHARSSNLYISSADKVDGTYSNALYQNTNKLLRRDTSQLAIKNINIDYCLTNINGRNNFFKFLIQGDITIYSVIITPHNYETATDFYNQLVIQMNQVLIAGASLAVISVVVDDCVSVLSSTIAYKFTKSSGIDYGDAMHGLFYGDYSLSLKTVSNLQYTRYIDILITELKSAEMGSTTFTEIHQFPSIDHIYRLFINESSIIPRTIHKNIINLDYVTYRHRTLTSFQITLFDEYQQILYSEVDPQNFEIPYLKYEMTINIIS